ncbi:MAG: hypothetical protein H3C47_15215 [Candidatus Cloacimonetes bacterium]|nr:hypothetical protein [Candidatus Cloacimonadota bacterium]
MSPLEKLLAFIVHTLFFLLAVLSLGLRYDWLPQEVLKPLNPYLEMLPKRNPDVSLESLPSTTAVSQNLEG